MDKMLLLLLFWIHLSSAFVNDLGNQLNQLNCSGIRVNVTSPVPNNPLQAINSTLALFCGSSDKIGDCVENLKRNDGKNDPLVWYIRKFVDKYSVINSQMCPTMIANGIHRCLLNATDSSQCYQTWLGAVHTSMNNAYNGETCHHTQRLRNCVVQDFSKVCPMNVARAMGEYATVLLAPDTCPSVVASESSSYNQLWNMTGSAIENCASGVVRDVTDIFGKNPNGSEHRELVERYLQMVCNQRSTIISCLEKKMPNSLSVYDHAILKFLDLKKTDKSVKNFCTNRKVFTDQYQCIYRPSFLHSVGDCLPFFGNINRDQGFALFDYACSAVVNMTTCLSGIFEQNCSKASADLLSETYLGSLTTECRNAKPRNVDINNVTQPGWSYTIVPGGSVAVECVRPMIVDVLPIFSNRTVVSDSSLLQKSILSKVCKGADDVLTCFDKKLPGGKSKVDETMRNLIDLKKLRRLVKSKCAVIDEIIQPIDYYANEETGKCVQPLSKHISEVFHSVFSMLVPATFKEVEAIFCGDDSLYYIAANCTVNNVRKRNSTLADHVFDILTQPLKDKCVGIKTPVSSACSVVFGLTLWFLVGILTFNYA
ncbi:hypothetical protein ScPMuIL_009861 [Solemya velum]